MRVQNVEYTREDVHPLDHRARDVGRSDSTSEVGDAVADRL